MESLFKIIEKEFGNDIFGQSIFNLQSALPNYKYPPYNIIKMSKDESVIEVALAGFKESEIKVTLNKNELLIEANKTDNNVADYIYKGIGSRTVQRKFSLTDDVIVEKASYVDGILSVYLKKVHKETMNGINIPISNKDERTYLTERDDIV